MPGRWPEHFARRLEAVQRGIRLLERSLTSSGTSVSSSPAAVSSSASSLPDIPMAVSLAQNYVTRDDCGGALAAVLRAFPAPLPSSTAASVGRAGGITAALSALDGVARLSAGEMERIICNAVADRIGLPPRFQWPLQTAASEASSSSPPLPISSTPANARLFLWAPAVQTSAGPRVIPSPPSTSTSPMLALPGSLFAFQSASLPAQSQQLRRQHQQRQQEPELRCGGGVLHSSRFESYLCLLHTAKTQALHRCDAATTGGGIGGSVTAASPSSSASVPSLAAQQRLVMYCSDQVDPLLLQAAALVGIPHCRLMQTVLASRSMGPGQQTSNRIGAMYGVNVQELKKKVVEDLSSGLFPCLIVGTFGSALSASADPMHDLAEFCHKTGVWFHVDASHGGAFLLSRGSHRGDANYAGDTLATRGRPATAERVAVREYLLEDFGRAAFWADSIQLSGTTSHTTISGIPFPLLPGQHDRTDLSLLYLANVQKLRWSLHALTSAKQQSANHIAPLSALRAMATGAGAVTAAAANASADAYLRLVEERNETDSGGGCSPLPAVVSAALVRSIASLTIDKASSSSSTAREGVEGGRGDDASTEALAKSSVRAHQEILFSIQAQLQGDGRFDLGLPVSPHFGRVFLRLLTHADEATARLATDIAERAVHCGGTGQHHHHHSEANDKKDTAAVDGSGTANEKEKTTATAAPVRLFCTPVVLQRRLWICLTLSPLQPSADNEKGPSDGETAAAKEAVRYVVSVVKTSADSVLSHPL